MFISGSCPIVTWDKHYKRVYEEVDGKYVTAGFFEVYSWPIGTQIESPWVVREFYEKRGCVKLDGKWPDLNKFK